jgi:drug/metabolite transporter (DMT)-like permease
VDVGMDYKVLLLTVSSAFIGSIGQIAFKKGSDNLKFTAIGLLTNYPLLLGFFLYAVSSLIYIYALSKERLSILYPVIATSYIWTTLFASVFLGEPVGLMNWVGIILIILGVALVARPFAL